MTQRKLHKVSAACPLKKITLFIGAVIFLMVNKPVFAQEQFIPPPAKLISKFEFKMLTGGIVILQARLDDFTDTLNFVLDTGSGGISLDSATVRYFDLPPTKSDRTIRGIAGVRNVSFVMNRTLHLPGLKIDSLNFHINDYELLTSVYGMKIDGIIGYSFLSRYIVKLDYDLHKIEVWKPGTLRYPRGGVLLRPQINNLPVFGARMRDDDPVAGRFYFDTGAGLCVLLSEDFVEDSTVLKKGKKITPTQAEGLGGKKLMNLTTLKEVRIGPYKFRKVPVYIFKDEFNVTAYPQLGGLIGNDLLRRFNLTINYPDREIYIMPNTHFNDEFDYSYTGLGVFMVDGEVLVEDVIEGSPGDKAGFKTGDVIFAIDNNVSKNIQVFKNLLQNPGAKLKVVVMRNNEPLVLKLEVKSIL